MSSATFRRLLSALPVLLLILAPFIGRAATGSTGNAPAAIDHDPTSPEEVFFQMRRSFRADRAKGQHLKYQFNFSDPQGGKWWVDVEDTSYTYGAGTIGNPNVTFSCTGADWVKLSNGTLGGIQAVLTGRLKVMGNQFDAHKLDTIFP